MMIVRKKKDVTTFVPGIHLHAEVLHKGTGVYELFSLPKTIKNFILVKTSLFPIPVYQLQLTIMSWVAIPSMAYSVLILSYSSESIMYYVWSSLHTDCL